MADDEDIQDDWLIPLAHAEEALPPEDAAMRYVRRFAHGSMDIGLYAPKGADSQSPHDRDELYVVTSGTGRFVKDGDERVFGPGDAIFVEAGAAHRFEFFSDDFAAWVIFWGPKGGE